MENDKSKQLFLKFNKMFNANFIGIFIGIITGLAINVFTSGESNLWYYGSVLISIATALFLLGALKNLDDYLGEYEAAKIGLIKKNPLKEPDSSEIKSVVFKQIDRKKIRNYNMFIILGIISALGASFLVYMGNNQISTKNDNTNSYIQKRLFDIDSLMKLNIGIDNGMNKKFNKLDSIIMKSLSDSNNKSPENSSGLIKTRK